MMAEEKFNFRVSVDPAKLEDIRQRIERALSQIEKKHGNVVEEERQKTGSLLDYHKVPVDDICYDHYKARQHRLMFPEDDPPPGLKGFARRFYRKVVRRLLRQQLVFNQSVVGTLDDMHQRLREIEKKLGIVSDDKDD